MAYTSGDLILDDHYNIFARGGAGAVNHNTANLNTIWGAGDGATKGWGQSGNLAAVSPGATITATQWASMLNRMNAIKNHEGVSITAITNPTAGSTVSAYSALSANVTTLWNNRGDCHASGTDITAGGVWTSTASWTAGAYPRWDITWSSEAAKKYFFNAGGMIRVSASRTGGTVSNKNSEWTDLLTQNGTICVTGGALTQTIAGTNYTGTTKIGGSGTNNILTTTFGVHDITTWDDTTWHTIFRQYADTAPYTGNYVGHYLRGISPTTLRYACNLVDAAADTVSPTGDAAVTNLDIVNGTLTLNLVVRPPSTTHISNTWGTPTITITGSSIS